MNTLRVAVDVGSRFHQVAIGDGSGKLLDEFRSTMAVLTP